MGDAQRSAFLDGLGVGERAALGGDKAAARQIELELHRQDAATQELLIELSAHQEQVDDSEGDADETQPVPFHDALQNVFGVVIPTSNMHHQRRGSPDDAAATEPLVPTPSTKRNLQSLAIALGLKRPILVAGPGGCGKTATIRELARLSGNGDMVELHLDDQIDSKTLLGSYVCTDVPGEFTWQPGALTTAVLAGRWVVIEDIDRAPFEVLASLMPLLETHEMVLPGRGELLVAHPNFQIFGTTAHGHQMPKGFQESVWTSVGVAPLADNEIEQIMLTRFVKIPRQVVSKIMVTYNAVSGNATEEVGGPVQLWKETRRNYGRDFCLRDLLKWCKRIYRFCYYAAGATHENSSSSHDYITEDERMRIVVEALDVFCGGIRDPKTRLHSACALAAVWEVQAEKIEYYLEQHKPHVAFNAHEVEFGRVHLPTLSQQAQLEQGDKPATSSVVMTGHVLRLLEKMAAIVATCEPALLIGETGCGKTTIIQHMAAAMGQRLVVQNLNIQSDSSDLVGGFKPVEIHLLARPLYMEFVDLFAATFSQKSNAGFLNVVRIALEHKDWKKLVKGMRKAIQMASSKLQSSNYGTSRDAEESEASDSNKMAAAGSSTSVLVSRWDTFESDLVRFERQKEQAESHFAFSFVEGVLVKALREGHWVLLDEINLASSDTLERISTLLEHETSAFSLTERGDVEIIRPHPNFRLFGAMNPSTDVGKKDLPPSLRNRFTEIYVDECVNPSDLQMVVHHQFKEIAGALVPETVEFYLEARKQSELRLSDGARHKPRYSLRTLSQGLHITRILIQRGYGTSRAMFEGFCSSFCTQLEMESRQYLEKLIKNTFAKTIKAKELARSPPCPGGSKKTSEFVLVSSYWVRKGDFQPPRDDSLPDPVTSRRKFVLTKSVEENLRHVSRAALIGKYPVLLQGPTSAGKTSLIGYLAARIGQKCVRINNHEHTDIQEYMGSYVSDANGKLAFKEGVLVEAVRKGWWIILDELNLAPSEVLEALNRLLDDNRELFLPETQETVKPHPKFMLFATQNPPGLYGGRKLQTILQERSSLPPSYCGILIDVMRQLQLVRQQSSVFAGKSGFITTRDLLRWAERRPATKQALAEEGYCLLAERLRKDEEKQVVKEVLEKKCNVKIDLNALYYSGKPRESNLLDENGEIEQETVWGTKEQFERVQAMVEQAIEKASTGKSSSIEPKSAGNAAGLEKISVTKSLRRLFALVGRCLQNEEPVLLVGETGCGKTTVCQLYSLLFSQPLHILNCHQHTETSDFLGCLRPVRGKEKTAHELEEALVDFLAVSDGCVDEHEVERRRADLKSEGIAVILAKYENIHTSVLDSDMTQQKERIERIDFLKRRFQSIFEWADGPLVESMKNGDLILIDEVNLAEDAVLERLNSVLEPSRTLLLAEKGGDQVEEIVAHSKWRVMATMNPGGDFGKRELSPALRNRFTEIWVPAISDLDDIATIIRDRLVGPRGIVKPPRAVAPIALDNVSCLCDPILSFVKTFNEANGGVGGCGAVTLRDILSWINFITSVVKKQPDNSSLKVAAWTAFVQGAALSILDGLGLGSDKALHTALKARKEAYRYLLALVPDDDQVVKLKVIDSLNVTTLSADGSIDQLNSFCSEKTDKGTFGISPFLIPRGPDSVRRKPAFSLKAPTTMSNLYRVLRAMQVSRPIILEGSPGVGKTSLISALAAASGHRLVRINLSEQTDISDLFGSDLPAASSSVDDKDSKPVQSGGSSGMFEWCDGVFLRALKAGDWVLLDELNLASQSVLEGLNSCLDHRGSVYIPELDREFECPPTFRVFAAQNPLRQGGGRKGLPKSFLNRFTRVFVETLSEKDLIHIASSMYPSLHCAIAETRMSDLDVVGQTLLQRMIGFNRAVHEDTMVNCRYGRLGAPWEFNLRDVFRFCDLLKQHANLVDDTEHQLQALSYYVNFIYVERMRSARDRELISKRFEEFFGVKPMDIESVSLRMSASFVEIGNSLLERRTDTQIGRVAPPLFNFLLKPMEALVHCVNMSWPALLVGPPASGKTSSVRLLAALSGNTLHELGMSAGTDATELLGCFEQVDVGRKLRGIKHKIQAVYEKVLQRMMLSSASVEMSQKKKAAILKKANRLSSTWWALNTRETYYSENASPRTRDSSGKTHKLKKLPKGQLDEVVVDLMKNIVDMLQKTEPDNEKMLTGLANFLNEIDSVVQLSKSKSIASCFEWVDGTLIQAMEKGEWVLLDNVNFCSSSVLDRLNSLMETGGEMLINECGIINGKLRVIKPHKNFRMFLAMDAQYGEVSRAMRNRCVEIALAEEDSSRLDLTKIPLACGIPGFSLSQAFQAAHERVLTKLGEFRIATKSGRINRRHLENWSLLASAELSRGVPPLNAVAESFQRVYGDDLLSQLNLSQEVFELFLCAFKASQNNSQKQRVLPMISCPSTFELCQQSEQFVLQRDVAYLEHLVLSFQKPDDNNAMDLQLSWLAPKLSVTTSEDGKLADSDTNQDGWLKCVASRCQQGDLVYTTRALEEAQNHLSSKSFFGNGDGDTPLAATLTPFALRQIVEVTSTCSENGSLTADRLLFALEKISHGSTGNSCSLGAIELLARFLQSMSKTALYTRISRKVHEMAERLTTLLDSSANLPPIPVHLTANRAVFLRLESIVAERVSRVPSVKNDLEDVWESLMITQRQLELLDSVEWLRFCEEQQYQQVDTLLAAASKMRKPNKTKENARRRENMNRLSVLQQSYAIHKYHADRSNVDNELIFLIHPLLNAFNVFFTAFIQDSSTLTMDSMLFEAVQVVLRDRFEFSIQLRVQVFEWTHFLIHWQWFKKSLLRLGKIVDVQLATTTPWTSPWSDLLDMTQRMQETIEKLIGCGSRKNVLWKKGGHALLPSSGKLWKAEYLLNRMSKTFMQVNSTSFSPVSVGLSGGSADGSVDVLALLFGGVTSMEAAIKSGKLDVSSLFYVDIDARKEVLHALCAFSYLAQEQTRGRNGGQSQKRQPHALMAEELFKLPDVLLKKLRDKQSEITSLISKKTLYLSEIEDNADSHIDLLSEEDSRIGKDAPILLFDMKESALLMDRIVTFQLSPLFEQALARQELQTITELVRVLNKYGLYKSDLSRDRYVAVVESISRVLNLLEGIIEELLRLGLRDPACFYAYQDIVWCGHKFNSDSVLSEQENGQSEELENFMSVVQSHLNGVLFGFHQFLRCNSFNQVDVISLEVFDTRKKLRKANKRLPAESNDVADHATVIAGYPRLFQAVQSAVVLKNIAEVDLEESMCPTSEAQMRAARLEKIKTHLAAEHGQAGKMMQSASFSFIRELFVTTVLAFESTFQNDSEQTQWTEIQTLLTQFTETPLTFDASAQMLLLRALRTSTDSTFVSLVDSLVAPFMMSASVEASLLHNDQIAVQRAIGESMVALGLWRFALLIPSSPVDPVTKPLVKKESLLNRLAMLTMQDSASLSINRLNPLPASSTASGNDISSSLRDVYCQAMEVSASAIQRYQPTKHYNAEDAIDVNQLEMTSVATTVFGELFRDLLRFNSTVMPADKLAALLSTARSSKLSHQRKRERLREMDMFQQTSESFLAQLSKKFGVCFRDIVEPIAAAIYCVKEGVALVTWSLYEKLKEASLTKDRKDTLALSLVQFPSSLNANTVDQSWCEIQLMLQTVGTPGTSIMFGAGVANKRRVEVALLDVALAKMEFLFRETVGTSRINQAVNSAAVDTALSSSKTLFDLFLTKWQEQKEREEQKQKEEEELFKYKVRQLDLETEEEMLEKEYREQFPDYSGRDFQAFLSPEQASATSNTDGTALPSAGDMDLLITDKIMQRLCETHVKLYAETSNSKIAVTKEEIVSTFARAFSLAVKLRNSLNATTSVSVESAVASSGVLAASLVQARLGSSVGVKKGAVPSFQALNSDYIRGIDFHRDPLVKEVVLVAEPLQRLMVKIQSLLAQWPDHAILQQIVLIADRIRNFEISSPLVRTLTGVELLLRKAQEWEMYAAKAYSISDELSALSALVTRWRKLELYSWPHLLYVKEKQHRFAAQKTWINMYSLLTAQFESDSIRGDGYALGSVSPPNLQWLHLNHLSKWLFTSVSENKAAAEALSDAARETVAKQREFMSRLFETLDAYIRSCSIGQYETRLLVVYSFCAQLFMELWSPSKRNEPSNGFASKSSKYALANMLYHLYRYYGQHLGYLERQWSGMKAPIQRKLVEFVKICRWDEQTYYSLAESAEKSHRKLMKFVRDYDAVLTVSMQTVIDASTDSGITNEGGFVGIQSTKAELLGLDDGVVVPKYTEHNEEEGGHNSFVGGEATENGDKKAKIDGQEDYEDSERPPALRLVCSSFPSIEKCDADIALQYSSYTDKLPTLSKRIAKYTQKHILSNEQIERRQHVRGLCEDLCETIFYRMAKLQKATGLPKGAKKKALIDLLSELKTQGMAYHRLQLPAEQQHIQQLFELDVPDVENCIRVDDLEAAVDPECLSTSVSGRCVKNDKKRGKKKGKLSGTTHQSQADEALTKNSPMWLWQRADGYYYRFLGQLASLRYSALTSFSHDLSSSETERMSGYAENMLFTMLQQRQILHATSLSHEKFVDGLATLKLMKQFKINYLSSDHENDSAFNSQTASKWQAFQQTSVISLRHSLRELEICVMHILQQSSGNASVVVDVRQLFQRIFERCDSIQNSFTSNSGLAKSLGVPAIPHRAVSASEDAGGDAAIVAFARPSKRVYGVSPVVASASTDEKQKMPIAVEVLQSNTAQFGEIQTLLSNASAVFGKVTTSNCLEAFLGQYAGIVHEDSQFAQTLVQMSSAPANESKYENESSQALTAFSEHYDRLVETVLVSIQDMTKISTETREAVATGDGDEEQSLRDQLTSLSAMVKDSRINHIATQLANLLELLHLQYIQLANTQAQAWRGVFSKSLSLLERFEPSLLNVRGISRQLLVDFIVVHKSVMKLDFVLIRIFRNLFQHGFCRTDEEKNDEEGDGGAGKMQFQDDVEGTGMGEGEGKKDVSDEIEDEEQLLGLQGDQQEEPEPPADQKPEDTGLEMQNDFEGTMQDVPDDEKNDQDENEDDEEELDREMGEFDQDDENVVDEKMWGEDSDDDEDNIDKEKEKFEEDSKVEGEALEDEVRGKDGDEEDKKDSDKKEDDQQKPQLDQSDEKGADEDEGGDDADGEDGDDEKMDEVNDDFEDKYEDHHDVDPTEREEGHGEDEAEEDHGDELPEDMQLENDADEGDDEGDADGENPDDENMDKLDDADDETAENADGDETAGMEEEEAEEEKEDEQLDNAVQLGGGGLEDEPEQAEEKEEEEAEKAEAPETTEQEQATSTVAGTQSKDGQDDLEAEEEGADDEEMAETDTQDQEQSNDDSSSSHAQKQSSSNDQDAKQEWKPQSQVESNPEQEQPREKRRDRREPNPYRNAQETQEHWKKRVEMVDRTNDEKEQDSKTPDKKEKAAEMTAAEFVDDDEEMEDVEHALAAADENQLMNQPRTEEEEEDAVEKKEEEETNPGNGATAMEVDEEDETRKDTSMEEQEQQQDMPKPVKQDPKPESDAANDSTKKEEQISEEKDMKPESATEAGEHDLLDEEADHALPSRLRGMDLTNTIQEDEGDEAEARAVNLLSPDEVAALRDELDSFIANWSSQSEQERGADLWAKYTALTAGASQRLCEQLRLVLEPMLRAKLEGDFRTGKRINMRKVIPYIASQFRKDKIWLRRTRPSKRQYQVMLAIDDSESMADNHAGRLALEALATLCKGMTQLEVGELSVVKFGQELELLHAFDTPFTDDAGSRLIGRFGFQQKKTNMVQTLDTILQLLETAKQSSAASSSTVEFTQIVFLISDGRFDSDGRVRIRKLIETALERQQLIVLLIVDQGAAETEGAGKQQQTSILDTQSVTFEKGKVRMVPYLENYPFPYYVLLPTSTMLPEILSDSLRQWFEMLMAKTWAD
ncbi:unnamed protein product [Phytophthora fragariaefolia]|uniref:Midasin n=1 Tax=Phytophthora fragariaefolia TaxID=1490495 RepID=A0A9W7DBP8_9STRA|nr:unnamed protein product [Phytophthora fragariaefolia]